MKILHAVEQYPPSVGGMQEVVRQLSERFADSGHEVTVVTSHDVERSWSVSNGVKIVEFSCSGNFVDGLAGDIDAYRDYVLNSDFDVVVCFAAQQWATDALLPILDQIKAAKVFVPTGFSALYDTNYRDYFEMLPTWLRSFDMNVFLSESYRDIDYAKEHGIDKITVIPNGADEREFLPEASIDIRKQLGISPRDLLILLVGSHTGLKGHAEAIEVFHRARIRHATLLIVAHEAGTGCENDCKSIEQRKKFNPLWFLAAKRLMIRPLLRAETVAAYQAADLMLFPSQIECSPLVLFEAMASRTPFLATDVGNAVELVRWSGGGVILPTKKDEKGYSRLQMKPASRLLSQMCNDHSERIKLADSGYSAWQKQFTWELLANRYLKVYQDAVALQ